MLRMIYMLIKDYGTFGAILASMGMNGFLFYKLFTNHLKHLVLDVQEVSNKVEKLGEEIIPIKERISKIEGMLD